MTTPSAPKPLIEHYAAYTKARGAIALHGIPAEYGWEKLTESVSLVWLPYCEMLREFSPELANSINELVFNTHRLETWGQVITGMDDHEKLDVLVEFVLPIATLSLNLPYVIRSRFAFATAHLSHQANRAIDGALWKDDFPLDGEIYLEQAQQYGSKWKKFGKLKLSLEKIGNKTYQAETRDFRNKYHHRFSPHIEIGLDGAVVRVVNAQTGGVSYSFGSQPPLPLSKVVALLKAEADACRKAHKAFQTLVGEQIEKMKLAP